VTRRGARGDPVKPGNPRCTHGACTPYQGPSPEGAAGRRASGPYRPCGGVGDGNQTYQPRCRGEPSTGDNGYRGSGFGPGEVALEIATTSKEGSRRATFPMGTLLLRTCRGIATWTGERCCDCNGADLDTPPSDDWRTSLVPTPTVIPAAMASL